MFGLGHESPRCTGGASWLLVVGAFLVQLTYPVDARAYLDPGTGSLLWQMAVAALMGTSFLIKTYWRQLKAYFAKPEEEVPRSDESLGRDEPE